MNTPEQIVQGFSAIALVPAFEDESFPSCGWIPRCLVEPVFRNDYRLRVVPPSFAKSIGSAK